jgi:hypothetical protein
VQQQKTTKVEIRLTPEEKLDWQTQADDEGVNVSTLIRMRMRAQDSSAAVVAPTASANVRPDLDLDVKTHAVAPPAVKLEPPLEDAKPRAQRSFLDRANKRNDPCKHDVPPWYVCEDGCDVMETA